MITKIIQELAMVELLETELEEHTNSRIMFKCVSFHKNKNIVNK